MRAGLACEPPTGTGDTAAGQKLGATGTPAFFVNGRFLSGAQPYETFKTLIESEIKAAEALVAKGTPRARVYDAIIKEGRTEVTKAATPQAITM